MFCTTKFGVICYTAVKENHLKKERETGLKYRNFLNKLKKIISRKYEELITHNKEKQSPVKYSNAIQKELGEEKYEQMLTSIRKT